jgi:hypothetical protein
LNFFDLMSSSYCVGDFSLRDDWKHRETRFQLSKVLRKVRNTDFIQAVTLVAGYTRRREAAKQGWNLDKLPGVSCSRSDVLKLTKEEYQTWADPVHKGFEEAARFLHGQKIFDADDVAYPIQLVALSAILTILGEHSRSYQVRGMLERWLWCGMFGEIYTHWHDGQAGRDVVEVPAWIKGGAVPFGITQANFSFPRLLSVKKRLGAVYQGFAALLRREGAVDWITGEEINDVVYFEEQINSHHIFPIAWCRKQGIDPKMYNCLVNRTPLSAKTNKRIGSKAPSAYLKNFELHGTAVASLEELMRSHCIELNILQSDNFGAFFQARAEELMELIGKAMGKNLSLESFEDTDRDDPNSNDYRSNPEIIAKF